eukprot:TRINITY_DN1923_c0_g1_i1.p1 TRINITY_DN1923_c0_g1~~TRINITY_DN1923_c0_g1_i1.p1  ORF type:complete len:2652 (-),score=902.80 TRINITY_DN1923_c0_g1_i1:9-7298(-)
MGELYGEFNDVSHEWTDGLIASIVRQCVAEQDKPTKKWVVFDGPVDALWIENMNTVLDDNKTLCLANGERIRLSPTMSMVFEVQDLAVASPATVSRCGMVYLEDVHLGWKALAKSWAEKFALKLPGPYAERVLELLDLVVDQSLRFVRRNCQEELPTVEISRVVTMLNLLESLLVPKHGVAPEDWEPPTDEVPPPPRKGSHEGEDGAAGDEEKKEGEAGADGDADASATADADSDATSRPQTAKSGKSAKSAKSAKSGVDGDEGEGEGEGGEGEDGEKEEGEEGEEGAETQEPEPEPVDIRDPEHVTKMVDLYFVFAYIWAFGGNIGEGSVAVFDKLSKEFITQIVKDFPSEGSVFDYLVDVQTESFIPWSKRLEPFAFDSSRSYFDILVPTVETTRYAFLTRALLEGGHHILLNGQTGVGKTVMVQRLLSQVEEEYTSAPLILSAQTTASMLQDIIEGRLEKKRKNLLGPPAGKKFIMFVDDMNMPGLDTYGSQPPIELLRQQLGMGGFYDRAKLFFKRIADTQLIASCGPPGGGRNHMTPRIVRYFNTFNVRPMDGESLRLVFRSILQGYLEPFPGTVAELGKGLVNASVDLYKICQENLLPTPSKAHYTFNLRDLSKLIQGLVQAKPSTVPDRETFVKLWAHEAARVIEDRLIDQPDIKWFRQQCASLMKTHFKEEWPLEKFANLMFGDVLTMEDKEYQEIVDPDELPRLFGEYQDDYNLQTGVSPSDLVFFKYAVRHITKIARIIRQPRGHALLVGVGGSGRQSLTRLAAFMAEYKCRQIEISKSYDTNAFHEDLKSVLMVAGVENRPIVFLFSDTQILRESFLEDINNILNSGEVPNLFAPDEKDKIVNAVRPLAKRAGKLETRDVVFQHFVHLVRENLHVVLAFSPVGDTFRNRIRMFPSLVNCCTIIWYGAWPDEALHAVAASILSKVDLGKDVDPMAMPKMCVYVHKTVDTMATRFKNALRRHVYTTPYSYLQLIQTFKTVLTTQKEIVRSKVDRFRNGLLKLEETNDLVSKMQEDLTHLQPVLKNARSETENLLVQVASDQKAADVVRDQVLKEEAEVLQISRDAQNLADQAKHELDAAMPAYDAAVKALQALNKSDINEVKSFNNPPELVRITMEAVCTLKNIEPTWVEAKKLLGQMDFLKQLEEYDKDSIPDGMLRKLKPYIKNPQFVPEIVQQTSVAAKSLCMWVHAMDSYAHIYRDVKPKMQRREEAVKRQEQAEATLAKKRQELADCESRVAALRRRYEESMQKLSDLEQQLKDTEVRLQRAEQLLSGLSSESTRWAASAEVLEDEQVNIVGNMALAAAYLAYGGPFTAPYRAELLDLWNAKCRELGMTTSDDFSLEKVLGEPVTIRGWNIMGLPNDSLSIENALMVTEALRWPLCIDPQRQANKWLKNTERDNNLVVCKLSEPNFMRTLENAVRVGTPVLLENIEGTLDPALEPVLLKQTIRRQGRTLIKLGDNEIDYSPDFRLYMTTKLANPHYLPELFVKVTVINFTVTPLGLEDQLLADVVRSERPDLQSMKDELVVKISEGQKQLQEIEDMILRMLAEASGQILDDEVLINTLAASKTTSAEINERLVKSEETAKEIDTAREKYRPAATRGSILYFVVADLALIDPMYQYSLTFFSNLFNQCLQKSAKSEDLEKRLLSIIDYSTRSIFTNVCRGLFERDRQLFSFLICSQILRQEGIVPDDQWLNLLKPVVADDSEGAKQNPHKWLPEMSWWSAVELSKVAGFESFVDDLGKYSAEWQSLLHSKDPLQDKLPGPWESQTKFAKLLILKVFREERLVFGMREVVLDRMGEVFTSSPPFDLESSFDDSSAFTPLIFVLSPGADPTSYLLNLAKQKGYEKRLKIISLGQGQGPRAQYIMQQARRSGDWVCLQNCHLAVSWLPTLEQLLEEAEIEDETNSNFRLWLTSMPSDKFPVPVLQSGLKMTNEPPKGVRANVMRTYLDIDEELFTENRKPQPWQKLLFGLSFFHAIIQERRKFGPIGWNIPYEWNTSDLQVSIRMLREYVNTPDPDIPFETLQYVIGELSYGGRVTDEWDQRCVRSILNLFVVPEILDDNYRFLGTKEYFAPPRGQLQEVRTFISELPLVEPPKIFGLHANADVTFQRAETKQLLDTIISVQPRIAFVEGGKSSDQIVDELAADIMSKLPKNLDKQHQHANTFKRTEDGTVNSIGVVLAQEMVRFNKLLDVIRASLTQLRRAIKGLEVMSVQLDAIYSDFLLNKVPQLWADAAYPSLKPLGSWVRDLVKRVEFLHTWLTQGPPAVFWLSGFFFPQGFLTGVLQTHARKTKIAIDSLNFRTHVLTSDAEEVTEGPKDGVYIHGVFMEGSRWDREGNTIMESYDSELYCPMPVMWLEPSDEYVRDPDTTYNCPVYKTTRRAGVLSTTGHSTNFIVALDIPTVQPADHWIRNGVALVSMLND